LPFAFRHRPKEVNNTRGETFKEGDRGRKREKMKEGEKGETGRKRRENVFQNEKAAESLEKEEDRQSV
jgi:hypothetical protein